MTSEHALLEALVGVVRRTDPDFLIGYKVEMASWGYLIERAAAIGVNLVNLLSRMPSESGQDNVIFHNSGRGGGGGREGRPVPMNQALCMNSWS